MSSLKLFPVSDNPKKNLHVSNPIRQLSYENLEDYYFPLILTIILNRNRK